MMDSTMRRSRRIALSILLLLVVAFTVHGFAPNKLLHTTTPVLKNSHRRIVVVRMQEETDEETPRKKTPRELVEMAYRLEKEEDEKDDFFSGVRNFFGSIFPGNNSRNSQPQPPQEKEDDSTIASSTLDATTSSLDEGTTESKPTLSNPETLVVDDKETEPLAPVEEKATTSLESDASEAGAVISSSAVEEPIEEVPEQTMDAKKPAEEEITKDTASEMMEPTKDPENDSPVDNESMKESIETQNSEELSNEDMIAMIELAQGSVPEGKIAGLEDFLATASVEPPPPPPPAPVPKPTQPAFDMEKVAEMARRAVEEYERGLAERDENAKEDTGSDSVEGQMDRETASQKPSKPAFVTQSGDSDSKQGGIASEEDMDASDQEVEKTVKPAFVSPPADSTSVQNDDSTESVDAKEDKEAELKGTADQLYLKPAFVPQSGETDVVDWSILTVPQLKQELDSRKLKKSGKKADLIARLEAHAASSMEIVAVETPEISDDLMKDEKESSAGEDSKSFSSMTVKELKDELKQRSLSVSGRKLELISRLEDYEAEHTTNLIGEEDVKVDSRQSSSEIEDDSPTHPEASDLESDDSPSDKDDTPDEGPSDEQAERGDNPSGSHGPDYGALTLKQLKDELRARGMPVSGKKSILIDRLLQSDGSRQKEDVEPAKISFSSESKNVETLDGSTSLQSGSDKFVAKFAVKNVVLSGSGLEDLATEAFESPSAGTTVLEKEEPLRSVPNPLLPQNGDGIQTNGVDGDSQNFAEVDDSLGKLSLDIDQANGNSDSRTQQKDLWGETTDADSSDALEQIHVGDFLVDKSLLPKSSEDVMAMMGDSVGDKLIAETMNDVDLDDFALDSSILEELDEEARPEISSSESEDNNSENKSMAENEDFDLGDFALDDSILEDLAGKARRDALHDIVAVDDPAVEETTADDIDLDDFAIDSSMLEDVAEEAREGVLLRDGNYSKETVDKPKDKPGAATIDDFDLEEFIMGESMIEDMAKQAREDLQMSSKTSMPDSVKSSDNFELSLDDFALDSEALNDIAEQARQTVDEGVVSSTTEETSSLLSIRDWSKVPLPELKAELEARGLPPDGARMSLVAALEVSDLERFDESNVNEGGTLLDEYKVENIDMNELSKAARDAQLMFDDDDEPSDEALMAIENELEREFASSSNKGPTTLDYESMAVSQLKKELKSRNLRVTGKKADLIARLRDSD